MTVLARIIAFPGGSHRIVGQVAPVPDHGLDVARQLAEYQPGADAWAMRWGDAVLRGVPPDPLDD